jgi:L-lactate dehydrogenase complex protein LldG
VERQRFLDNIAARLGRPRLAAAPSRTVSGPPEAYCDDPLGARAATMDRAARFKHELELVGGKVTFAASLSEVHAALRAELAFWKAERLVSWAPIEFEGWALDSFLRETRCTTWRPSSDPADQERFRKAGLASQLGITTVDFAIANTGTLAASVNSRRPRAVSLLPGVHLALVRQTQIVDRLGLAFEAFRQRGVLLASNVHFITGPSRTSDIENDLSIGVHGPAAVSVILWRDGPPRGVAAS